MRQMCRCSPSRANTRSARENWRGQPGTQSIPLTCLITYSTCLCFVFPLYFGCDILFILKPSPELGFMAKYLILKLVYFAPV